MSQPRLPLLLTLLVLGTGVGAGQEPQYRVGTHMVPVYATVTDRDGRLVTDLTRADFEVQDNGRPQPLVAFANGQQPITVVMMIDRSGSVEAQFRLVEEAAAEFVRHLTPQDRARVGSFSAEVEVHPETFTSDSEELLGILRNKLQPMGATPLWLAANTAMSALAGEQGRRVVLIFSDGRDAPLSEHPPVSYTEVRTRAEREEVMVYAIGLVDECEEAEAPASLSIREQWLQRSRPRSRGGGTQGRGGPTRPPGRIRLPPIPLPLPRPPGPGAGLPPRVPSAPEPKFYSTSLCRAERPDPSLRELAEVGGGGFFVLRQAADLSSTFARVARELHHQYLLGFVAQVHDGALHRVDVRVRRSGTVVRARQSYRAPGWRDPH